ncbi:methyltransferase domain-containing protein [Actinoplanes sp. NEAU-A12]|uniref:Methyltransferase domain-containing protein n=1 Tax=Actinoplanes sandaracinus TaxID=3045177 RepID=A0ABT6WS95_9ACTN|nr:class I SAM-dependent methyltransferase [Actinoplanes sandaracinus]MDI6102569.1 methyltransferase domain-containing protein [Actinoplanes sandaracinus]
MSGQIEIFNEAADDYDRLGVDFFTPFGAALTEAAGIKPGDRVLDVGCGRGAVLFPAAAAAGPAGHVTGIDLATRMVELTRAAAAGLPNVTVEPGDAQAPDFPDASFDVITAGLVLFFLPDPGAALAAYRRLLRPGGRLAFSAAASYDDYFVEAMKALAGHADGPPPPPAGQAEMFDNADTLRAAVGEAGFSGTDVRDHTVASTFRDRRHFFSWINSHGGRAVTRRIPQQRREAALADLAAVLPEPITLSTTMHLGVAST